MGFSRRSPAATGRIVTAVLTLGLAVSPPASKVLAQSEEASPPAAAPETQAPLATSEAPPVSPEAQPIPEGESPGDSSAVFDAPGMPGVRMMAPIPDRLEPPASPTRGQIVTAPPARMDGSDRGVLSQALAAGHDWNRARLIAAQSANPVVKLIVEWRYLLDEMSGASFDSINAFLNAHPGWPRHDALLVRAEKTMPDLDPRDVIAWYANRQPLSGVGYIRLGSALMDNGKRAEGSALIRKGWIDFTFSPFDEKLIVAAHSDVLGAPEHKARLLKLLAHEDIGGAKRQMLRADAGARRLGNALLQIKAKPAAAKQVLADFPDFARSAPELLFETARALRRRNQDEAAWDLMTQAPANKEDMAVAERWSSERQIMARDALKAGRFELAYQFASTPALDADSGTAFMDAEFLAGWIALRNLHKPELARYHFNRLAQGVTFPISVARAHYWLGRTWEAMSNPATAADEYRGAAYYSATFYGQLALAKIAERPMLHVNNVVAIDPLPSERAAFEADDRVQAMRLLMQTGDRGNVRIFALAIASSSSDAKRLQMLAELVASTGDQALAVKVAKNASYSDIYLQPYLHPLVPLPKSAGDLPEAALVLGLTRQESEFDSGAVSVAGARGLMQLMPASAKHAASMSRLAYRPGDLNNPEYNMQLGMATLAEYLDRWDGSYVLGIASYNAGPSNVRNWVETYGDPREPGVDPIDWIESIPYPETRNYVQRVLENLQVYRNRLSNSDQSLVILSDLYRPNPVGTAAIRQADSTTGAAAQNAKAVVPGASAVIPETPPAQ
jgi:soluble lytic murein transglycosylase